MRGWVNDPFYAPWRRESSFNEVNFRHYVSLQLGCDSFTSDIGTFATDRKTVPN